MIEFKSEAKNPETSRKLRELGKKVNLLNSKLEEMDPSDAMFEAAAMAQAIGALFTGWFLTVEDTEE